MSSPHKLLILYASQTGTAQEFAERIWRESKSHGFDGPIGSMDDHPIDKLPLESLVVFVASTTGQGDPPDNMNKFWKFLLRKSLPANSLQNMKFGVLGLGDSSYVKFNFVAKKLHRRLESLGATPLLPVGLADDQHDLGADAVVDVWLSQLWTTLSQQYPNVKVENNVKEPLTRWLVNSVIDSSPTSRDMHWMKQGNPDVHQVDVISNERLTPDSHFQDVRLIKFKLPSSLEYSSGDVAYVYPHNRPTAVRKCLEILNDSITELRVAQLSEYMPVPKPLINQSLTYEQLATSYWDLNSIPKRYTFELLAHFSRTALEREKLLELSSTEGQEDLLNYARRPKRTILEMLTDFPSAINALPAHYVFEIFSPIRPRAFSIASSPTSHTSELHLLVAVVKYKTKLLAPRYGLCSNYLASLNPGDSALLSIKRGSFAFPKDTNIPIIMIGPGTGVAPFRSYIHSRISNQTASSSVLYLFYGCRNEQADYYFHEEWAEAMRQDQLSVFTAFSRDQEEKIYVQNVMTRHLTLLSDLICTKHGYVMIAGSAKEMPQAVIQVVEKAVALKVGASEVQSYVARMESTGRLQTETWS